jgi:thiosulfate reductase cytochrome b subunit
MAAGLWLALVAVLMALRPHYCLHLLEKMASKLDASSWRLNLWEQGLRLLAGAALIVRSPASKLPLVFEIAGWLIVASSLLILAAPIRWHAAYGFWWSERLTPPAIRFLSPLPAVVGAGLVYAAF